MNKFLIGIIQQSLILSIGVMGIYITYNILKFADLSADGTFTLGASTSAILILNGLNPFISLLIAMIAGAMAGVVTGVLNVKLKIQDILASILVMVGLHSINLRVMGGVSNLPLFDAKTIFQGNSTLIVIIGFVILAFLFFTLFFKTKLGYLLKGIGDNESMITSLGIDIGKIKILALAISNSFIALAGGIMAQYQSFSDINMGRETMIMGLAAIIIGYNLFRKTKVKNFAIHSIVGTFIYRFSIAMSLKLGLNASDLRLISSIIVVIALVLGNSESIIKESKLLRKFDFSKFSIKKVGSENANSWKHNKNI